jgi:FkbM family methyltransferase
MIRQNIHAVVWAYRHATGKLRAPELASVLKFIDPRKICFDVGAHGGAWSRGLARSLPETQVYAFEALPYYARVLRTSMMLLGQKRVQILNVAIGERQGNVQMATADKLGNRLTGKTHVAASHESTSQRIAVPLITLDTFWESIGKKPVGFVKCDVEGFELFVINGAKKLIEECRPVFFNELNAEWCNRYSYTPQDVFSFFDERHYVPKYIEAAGDLSKVDVETHSNRDVLFLPQERLK